MSERLTSSIYSHRGRQDADPASVNVLSRKFWRDEGGAIVSREDLLAAPDAVRLYLTELMTRRHGARVEKGRRR